MHKNFKIILQTAFNCFAKNELNQSQGEAPAKLTKTLRKITAKIVKSDFFTFCFKCIIFHECAVQSNMFSI